MNFWVNEREVAVYQPPGHYDTFNRLLLGRDFGGLQRMEVIVGEMGPGGYAAPHAHGEREQVMYVISGSLKVRVGSDEAVLSSGSAIAIPVNVVHEVWCVSPKAKFLVVYARV